MAWTISEQISHPGCGIVNDTVGSPPVRLDAQLVADLPGGPDFERVVSMVNDLAEFYLMAAGDAFGVLSPVELHARGFGEVASARSRLLFFCRLLYLRAAELLPSAVRAVNESRLISFALATRGLLETAAVAGYHAECLAIEEGATALPGDYLNRLRAAVLAGRFDWQRYFADPAARLRLIEAYDANPGDQQPPDAARNIVTMVDKLGRRLGRTIPKARGTIHFDYALLSDICHPSAGSNLIFLAGSEPQMRAELVPQRVTLLGLATLLLPCLAYSGAALKGILAELEELDQRLTKMPTPGNPPPSADRPSA